jgi:hypothetical protein
VQPEHQRRARTATRARRVWRRRARKDGKIFSRANKKKKIFRWGRKRSRRSRRRLFVADSLSLPPCRRLLVAARSRSLTMLHLRFPHLLLLLCACVCVFHRSPVVVRLFLPESQWARPTRRHNRARARDGRARLGRRSDLTRRIFRARARGSVGDLAKK